jgi:syntaxin 5
MSSNFKTVLETRTESLRRQKERRDQFAQSPIATKMVPSSSALLRDDAGQGEDTKIDIDGAESQMQMLEQQVCLVIF